MSRVTFDASVQGESRGAAVSAVSGGFRVQTDAGARVFRRYNQALNEVRDYLGPFLGLAERRAELSWGLRVCVATGCAFYGPHPPFSGGGGVPVAPDELLARIRRDYREGDGPISALQNALRIARHYPPEAVRDSA